MKKMKLRWPFALIATAAVLVVAGCGDQRTPAVAKNEALPEVVTPPKRDHNYEVREDMDYGYAAVVDRAAKVPGVGDRAAAPVAVAARVAWLPKTKRQMRKLEGLNIAA